MNQMGIFPSTPSKFNKYIMAMYVYNVNAKMMQQLKIRKGPEISPV